MDKAIQLSIKTKRVESSLVLLDCINRIWTILKDKAKVDEISNSINYSLKIAQFFQMDQTNQSPIQFTCKDLITNNFYKSISYLIQFLDIKTIWKFMLYPNTLDNTTLLLLEIEYEHKELNEVDSFYKDISVAFLEDLSKYLRVNTAFLNEYQSILINCNLAKTWNLVVINKHMDSVSPNEPEPVKLFDKVEKIGDKFIYTMEKEVKYGKVTICDRDNRKKWTFAFEVYDKDYAVLYCQISFFFLSINENMVFIAHNHDFKEPIDQISLNATSKRKKDFLNDIKKYLEK